MGARKAKRPALTTARAKALLELTNYAESEASLLLDGPDDQRAHANRMLETIEWLESLAHWKLNT
jgi:hypothetical protein